MSCTLRMMADVSLSILGYRRRCAVMKRIGLSATAMKMYAWRSRNGLDSASCTANGVDISEPTVRQARAAFSDAGLRAAVADVRSLPFRDGSFDAVYSMGTIEHFRDPETALREIHRVLRPGGRAVVGVPNRWDPFLRPLLAAVLQALRLYGYGYERSFSRRALRRMLEAAGFEVVAETAILFVPGWLRMADLALHSYFPPLAGLTAAALAPFAWLDEHVPAVRRHGYLLASVGVRRPR